MREDWSQLKMQMRRPWLSSFTRTTSQTHILLMWNVLIVSFLCLLVVSKLVKQNLPFSSWFIGFLITKSQGKQMLSDYSGKRLNLLIQYISTLSRFGLPILNVSKQIKGLNIQEQFENGLNFVFWLHVWSILVQSFGISYLSLA